MTQIIEIPKLKLVETGGLLAKLRRWVSAVVGLVRIWKGRR